MKYGVAFTAVLIIAVGARAKEDTVALILDTQLETRDALRTALALELGDQHIELKDPLIDEKPSPAEPGAAVSEKSERAESLDKAESEQSSLPNRETRQARQMLHEMDVIVVLWMRTDDSKDATWLCALSKNHRTPRRIPLPYPPEKIEPRLFAIAAASLLDQVIREDSLSQKGEKRTELDPRINQPIATASTNKSEHKPGRIDDVKDNPRFYLQFGFAFGLSAIYAGMTADSRPPDETLLFMSDGRFNTDLPWISDADSFDQQATPEPYPSGECPADGVITGKNNSDDSSEKLPSKYCARVHSSGFVTTPALRLEVGYWLLPRFALAAITRVQFDAGEGTLSHLLLGLRAKYLFTPPESDISLALFGGATVGQIQPSPSNPDEPKAPYIVSGPLGIHGGAAIGWWFGRYLGIFLAPELDYLFPELLLHLDLTFGLQTRL